MAGLHQTILYQISLTSVELPGLIKNQTNEALSIENLFRTHIAFH